MRFEGGERRASHTSGLTPEELAEQKELYKEYLANIRSQLKAQLDNIEVVDELPDKKQLH